tara:strand:+ start:114 stop:419 length:306 start_codon:yes stop_codon:yes gene_type:complete
MKKRNKKVVCADGFSMSVQAHDGAYCTPREGDAERYTEVELGYPSEREELIMDWIEVPDGNPTESIYPYIPVDVVTTVIVKHGGMAEGEVPPGVIPIPEVY